MKRILFILTLSIPLFAADTIEVPWSQLCREANFHELSITTTTGETVDGYCMGIDVNQISIGFDGKAKRVARASVARLLMRGQGHQLRSLGKGVRGGLSYGLNALLSPQAVVGAVAIPATLRPLGDLKAKQTPNEEITIK